MQLKIVATTQLNRAQKNLYEKNGNYFARQEYLKAPSSTYFKI
jgi:hypothetical protein